MEERYARSVGTLTEAEIKILQASRVAVVGCGGLGGAVIEMLGRMGIGQLTVFDGDVFEESNLNRQLLSEEKGIGTPKVDSAVQRMQAVNSAIKVIPMHVWIDAANSLDYLLDHDVVIDALDTIELRLVLQKTCKQLNIPMIHGAIGGWYGQVSTIMPGDDTLFHLYKRNQQRGIEASLGNPSFTPFFVASIQAAEAIKVLIGRGDLIRHQVLRVDLLTNEYTQIAFE